MDHETQERETLEQVEAELRHIEQAFDEEPTETLEELVARKRREQGICIEGCETQCCSS